MSVRPATVGVKQRMLLRSVAGDKRTQTVIGLEGATNKLPFYPPDFQGPDDTINSERAFPEMHFHWGNYLF